MSALEDYINNTKQKALIKKAIKENSAELAVVDADGKTIVHHAAERGDSNFLGMIYAYLKEEYLQIESNEGKIPIEYAAQIAALSANFETFNLLKNRSSSFYIREEDYPSILLKLFADPTTQVVATMLMHGDEELAVVFAEELGSKAFNALFNTLTECLPHFSGALTLAFNSTHPTILDDNVQGLNENGVDCTGVVAYFSWESGTFNSCND